MLRRLLFSMALALSLGWNHLGAQSYQTSFSSAKFDRAKGPATFTAGVEVDAATGAASMNIPFGPGIGERGLKFRPSLSMRINPQMAISTSDENVLSDPNWATKPPVVTTMDTLYQRGFGSASFSPGTFDLGTMVSTMDRKKNTYALPGGGGGHALGQLPSSMTTTAAQSLLMKFGYSANDTIGNVPSQVGFTPRVPLIQMGSDGSLILGLRAQGGATQITDEVSADIQQNPASVLYQWDFPRRVVVINGEVAYEFHYVHHTYMIRVIPYLANKDKNQLYSGHYVITRIRNKFGESIDFTYDADGIGYTATWSTNPAVKIRVQVVGTTPVPAGQPRLNDSRFQVTAATQIRVSYLGISQPTSSYLLEVSDPSLGTALRLASGGGPESPAANSPSGTIDWDWTNFDTSVQSIQPLRVLQEATSEEIRYSYGVGPSFIWNSVAIAPTVVNAITYPTRTVNLVWDLYRYRPNYSPEAWGGFISSVDPGRPAVGYGVVRLDDMDGIECRQTRHTRVLPISNWSNEPMHQAPADQWVDTTFYDAITQPDGSVSVHRFVSPSLVNGITGADGMQNLAFIKTLEREVRFYEPGIDWQADLSVTSPASSSAFKWVVKDRFDVRSAGAPNGELTLRSVPYPTRVRTWEKESQILTVEESTDWDTSAFGWKTSHTFTAITAAPLLPMDYLSLKQKGLSNETYPTDKGGYLRTDKTFEPKQTDWIFARVKTEQTTTVSDSTGFIATGVTIPSAEPLLTRTFNADINRVEAVGISNTGAPTVTTNFTFQGTTGITALEMQSAYLNSPGLGLSGQLGVSAYGYDALGHLSSISQKPNVETTLTVTQVSDEIGRPITQTDMDGGVKTFTWDSAGRLSAITSSDGDAAISISYNDTDHRGITMTQGTRVMEFRYNAYGNLILERRTGEDGSKSHRLHGYDKLGRRTGETVWLSGDGSSAESAWILPNLTRDIKTITTTQDQTICKRWGVDEEGNAVCISWQTIPGTTTETTTAAAYAGVATGYDGRGRVNLTQDANKVQTTTEFFGPGTLPPGITTYVGPVRRVTIGPGTTSVQVKWLESDATGRLVRLITPVSRYTDPLNPGTRTVQNLKTEYRYDGGNRIKEVRQIDEANRTQIRSWGYNRLGWLDNLVQPESGTTSYGAFTVAGKPTTTNYNGRTVQMTPDWMGRPTSVTSTDGTVNQAFLYDTALNGKGQLSSSTDGGVTTTYRYGGLGKRLDALTTKAMVQGVLETFNQTFAYDSYGSRTGGSTSHGGWTQSYHPLTGLPNVLSYGAQAIASTPWVFYDPTSWAVKSIAYGNGAASSFEYDPDQARLKGMKHLDGQTATQADWLYNYDEVGNLTREFDKQRPDGAGSYAFDQYAYDELNRLISAVIQSPTYGEQLQQFDYDAFGNRVSSNIQRVTGWSGAKGASTAFLAPSTLLNPGNSVVVNAAFTQGSTALLQNRLPATTSAGLPTGAVYDAQGNLTKVFEKPTSVNPVLLTMAYDALGRVLSVSSTRTGLTETYQYSAEGLRTLIQEYSGTTLQKTRVNLYNDARQVVSQWEKTASGSLTWKRDILYLGTREAAEIDANGMHVTQVDHLGSPRVVTGPTGTVESRQKYLPYGELLEQSGTFKSAKGYTNHEQTDSSGLIYMQARFYVPWFGRFASPDPARDQHFEHTQSWNIYSYVRNSPVMSTDPTGMIMLNEGTRSNSATGNFAAKANNEAEEAARKKREEERKKKEAQTESCTDGKNKKPAGAMPLKPRYDKERFLNEGVHVAPQTSQPKPQTKQGLYPVYVWDNTRALIPHTFIQTPNKTKGFYPKASWHYAAAFVATPGEVRDDSDHPRNADPTYAFWVDATTLSHVEQGMEWSPTVYTLNNGFWSRSYNCTGWANTVLSNAGLTAGWRGVGANPWTN
ncbi:MAG: RHS repeat-associated core domain-containing protein [Geothrix sp.]|uniref:RHS repeat domain-containing protein n=1 Tax=Geothrix sp. TaxID=1962974 RepID=UPI003BAF7418